MTSKTDFVAESWEDYDNDIPPPLPTPIILSRHEKDNAQTNAWSNNSLLNPGIGAQVRIEGSTRSEFTPQIRILNRNSQTKEPSSPTKTNYESLPNHSLNKSGLSFEEKQRAYNEARKRIMGETDQNCLNSFDDSSISNTISLFRVSQTINQRNNIIRNPIGPDGTKGFNQKRS